MKETLTRLLSGIVYVVVLIVGTMYSYNSFLLLFGIFLAFCTIEFCGLVKQKYPLPLIISLLIYVLFSFFDTTEITNLLLLAATLFVSVKCLLFLFSATNRRTDPISNYIYLIGYIVLPIVLITKLPLGKIGYNPKIVISIFILVWTNDTFAYIVGKSIGKHKLFERISPKKTVEGFVGGLLFSALGGFIIAREYIDEDVFKWIVIALLVSLFGTLGDLIESKFKRVADVKDSGNVMPGHGGLLDRLDSIVFAVPIIFLFYQISNYVS